MLFLFGACCKWGHHLYTTAAPSCCVLPSYCHLSATLQTMSITVANLQDNRAVFHIFITLLRFSFDSPLYRNLLFNQEVKYISLLTYQSHITILKITYTGHHPKRNTRLHVERFRHCNFGSGKCGSTFMLFYTPFWTF